MLDTAVGVTVIGAVIGGLAWLGKSIVKPWSDASLTRAKAFEDHVHQLGGNMNEFLGEFRRMGSDSKRATEASQAQARCLEAIQKDTADIKISNARTAEQICKVPTDGCHASIVAEAIKETARQAAIHLHLEAEAAASKVREEAAKAVEIVRKGRTENE